MSPQRPPKGKEQVSVYLPDDLVQRARGAIHALQIDDPELSNSEFYTRAVEQYVTAMEKQHNQGQVWPAPARPRRGRAPRRTLE